MFYHEDWLLRQIEAMIAALIKILLRKSDSDENSSFSPSAEQGIEALLAENKICEAENFIFELAESKNCNSSFKIL